MRSDPIRLRRCRCGSAAKIQGGAGAFYIQCRNGNCGMMTAFCSSLADAAARWNRCMGAEDEAPAAAETVNQVCEWWSCRLKDVAQRQHAWCEETGWSCGRCPYSSAENGGDGA